MTDSFDKTRGTEKGENGADTSCQFLTFTVTNEVYGVDIMSVREIKGWTETTRLPNSPEYMRGVMNLRGLIIPIFDLRTRLHGNQTEATIKNVIIILAVGERNIGILVDAVSDILTINNDEIKPAPEMHTQADANYIRGLISLESRMVALLAVDKLFNKELLLTAGTIPANAA